MPPVFFLVAIMLMGVLHWIVPISKLIDVPISYFGAIFIAIGMIVVIVPARAFETHATTIRPFEESNALLTDGLYRLTRNPMYLGMVVVLIGIAILLGTAASFLPIPVFIVLIQKRFIVQEEAMLTEKFGDRYVAYCNSVRRWI